jgi:hypothetical protein
MSSSKLSFEIKKISDQTSCGEEGYVYSGDPVAQRTTGDGFPFIDQVIYREWNEDIVFKQTSTVFQRVEGRIKWYKSKVNENLGNPIFVDGELNEEYWEPINDCCDYVTFRQEFVYSSGPQEFTLDYTPEVIVLVSINGYGPLMSSDYILVGSVVKIIAPNVLSEGSEIVIIATYSGNDFINPPSGAATFVGTHQQISLLKSENNLNTGGWYILLDYATKHLIPTTTAINEGPLETLVLFATSNNTFSNKVFSPSFPKDNIEYDFDNILCEDGTTPRKGLITYRKDTVRNITTTKYDFRNTVRRLYKVTTKQNEIPTLLSGSEVDLLLTFSPNLSSTSLTVYQQWHVDFPEVFANSAGSLNITIRKGSFSYTRPLLKSNFSPTWAANELANKKGLIVYSIGTNSFVFMNFVTNGIGDSLEGLYISDTQTLKVIGNNVRYNVDNEDFIDVKTFQDGNTISDVFLEGQWNTFFGNVFNSKFLGNDSNNNVFLNGEVAGVDAVNFFNNIVASRLLGVTAPSFVGNSLFISNAIPNVILGEIDRCTFLIGRHFQKLNGGFFGDSTIVQAINPPNVSPQGNWGFHMTNVTCQSSGIFLNPNSNATNTSINAHVIQSLIGLTTTVPSFLIINKLFYRESLDGTPNIQQTIGDAQVDKFRINELQTPEGQVKTIGTDENGNVVESTANNSFAGHYADLDALNTANVGGEGLFATTGSGDTFTTYDWDSIEEEWVSGSTRLFDEQFVKDAGIVELVNDLEPTEDSNAVILSKDLFTYFLNLLGAGLSYDGDGKIQLGEELITNGLGSRTVNINSWAGDTSVEDRETNIFVIENENQSYWFIIQSTKDTDTNEFVSMSDYQQVTVGDNIVFIEKFIQEDGDTVFRIHKGKTSGFQEVVFGEDNLMSITDTLNSKGLENTGDYEANFTDRSLVTKQYADGIIAANYVAVPSSETATGVKGQRAYDSTYVYECVDTDTWVRYAITPW